MSTLDRFIRAVEVILDACPCGGSGRRKRLDSNMSESCRCADARDLLRQLERERDREYLDAREKAWKV